MKLPSLVRSSIQLLEELLRESERCSQTDSHAGAGMDLSLCYTRNDVASSRQNMAFLSELKTPTLATVLPAIQSPA